MTRVARSTVLLAAVALLAACAGDDDTTPSTTTEPGVATSVPPSTEPTTPPTAPPTRVPPTTTATTVAPATNESATTSVPSTLPPPTAGESTSVPPSTTFVSDEEAALSAVEGAHRVWLECIRDVAACDTSNFSDYFVEPGLSGARNQISDAQANGYVVDDVDQLTYEVLEIHLDGPIPYVVVCQSDGSSLVDRQPGQPDRVVEGGYNEKVREVQLAQTPLGWRVEGYATVEEVHDEVGALCG